MHVSKCAYLYGSIIRSYQNFNFSLIPGRAPPSVVQSEYGAARAKSSCSEMGGAGSLYSADPGHYGDCHRILNYEDAGIIGNDYIVSLKL